jgi:hypothetical protein
MIARTQNIIMVKSDSRVVVQISAGPIAFFSNKIIQNWKCWNLQNLWLTKIVVFTVPFLCVMSEGLDTDFLHTFDQKEIQNSSLFPNATRLHKIFSHFIVV